MEILMVKLTSMGDLIQLLPALTDLHTVYPAAKVDWVIDRSFQEIAHWHPIVRKPIISAHRVWRKNIWQTIKSGEIAHFLQQLRAKQYDYVVDAHSMLKTAIISWLAKGKRVGLDSRSATEKMSTLFYNQRYTVDRSLHVVTRLRLLLAQIFNYDLPKNLIDYGIRDHFFPPVKFALPKPYVVFIPNATWSSKLWSESHWRTLIQFATEAGLSVLLPWGNEMEHARVQRLAQSPNTIVLPRCSLSEIATILQNAVGAVCCETGFCHLAAALNVPALTLYGPNDPAWIGTVGGHQFHIESEFACRSCYKTTCHYHHQTHNDPPCMTAITPQRVWLTFKQKILRNSSLANPVIHDLMSEV